MIIPTDVLQVKNLYTHPAIQQKHMNKVELTVKTKGLVKISLVTTTHDKINLNQVYILILARYRIRGPAAPKPPCFPGEAEGSAKPPA